MSEKPESLEKIGKKIGVKDMVALNDFIDASIYTAFEFTLKALSQRMEALEQQVAEVLRQLPRLAEEQEQKQPPEQNERLEWGGAWDEEWDEAWDEGSQEASLDIYKADRLQKQLPENRSQ